MGQKFEVLGGSEGGGEIFNPNNETPLGNQSPPEHVI